MQLSVETKTIRNMTDAVDDLLAGLVANRQTMQRQSAIIDEILEKSNNTLIHIESRNKALAPATAKQQQEKVYNVKPACKQALVKILQNYKQLMQQHRDEREDKHSALDGCLAYRQRVDQLASTMRKLVALCNTVHQMKTHQEDLEAEEQDSP